jgi:ribosomal protein S12 methylthiotransferase accessory factor YcaO
MANNTNKAKDPTAAAMSAIQEALSARNAEMKTPRPAPKPARKAATEPAP